MIEKGVNSKRIAELMNQITKQDSGFSRLCKAYNVDSENNKCDCEPIDNIGGASYTGVLLSPTKNSDNIRIPKEGSTVIVSFLNTQKAFISQINVTEKHKIASSDSEGVLISSQKQIEKKRNEALKVFAKSLYDSIMLATFKHPYGPTSPEPINKTQFDDSLDAFNESIDDIDQDIENLYSE